MPQKSLQWFCSGCYSVFQVIVIGSYQGVAEKPRVSLERVILHIESEIAEIFYQEYSGCAGIALTERMNGICADQLY